MAVALVTAMLGTTSCNKDETKIDPIAQVNPVKITNLEKAEGVAPTRYILTPITKINLEENRYAYLDQNGEGWIIAADVVYKLPPSMDLSDFSKAQVYLRDVLIKEMPITDFTITKDVVKNNQRYNEAKAEVKFLSTEVFQYIEKIEGDWRYLADDNANLIKDKKVAIVQSITSVADKGFANVKLVSKSDPNQSLIIPMKGINAN